MNDAHQKIALQTTDVGAVVERSPAAMQNGVRPKQAPMKRAAVER